MALERDNIRQQAFGSSTAGTSVTVGFDPAAGFSACAAGSTVILIVTAGLAVTTPAGFVADLPGPLTALFEYVYRLPVTAGGETTWTVSQAAATSTCWSWGVWEVTGLNLTAPLAMSGFDGGAGFSLLDLSSPSGELGSGQRLDTIKFGVAGANSSTTDFASASWAYAVGASANVNWAKVGDFRVSGAVTKIISAFFCGFSGMNTVDPAHSQGLYLGVGSVVTPDEALGLIVTYAAADSPTLDPIVMGTGFEFGTHHGITGGPTAAPGPAQIADAVSGTHGTTYQVTTTAPKNGTYHLRVTNAAAAGWVRWSTNTLGTGLGQAVFGGYVKCVSASTNPAVLVELAPAAGTMAQVVYNPTTTKLGVRWGTGTVAYQASTTALGSYAWIDLRATFNATTWVLVWRCEEAGVMVTQTGPANLTAQTASTWATATLGATVAQTATADYDDICLSNATTDYPLSRHKVVLLVPDTAVAAGLAASAGANWSALTNNVVGSTVTVTGAANVPALLDEVPPNFSATADGVAVVTASTSDIVLLDMTTYTASATERIDSVRVYVCGWAASTATAALGLRVDTGSSVGETTLISGGVVHGTFINTTTGTALIPGWYAKNYPQASSGWTQTLLDALRIKLGYSTDATPDIGALAVYAEVAVCTDFVPALPAPGEWVFQRAPRPVESAQVVGPYIQSYPSTYLGG